MNVDDIFGAPLDDEAIDALEDELSGPDADSVFGAAVKRKVQAVVARRKALPTPRMMLAAQTIVGGAPAPSATLAAVGDQATFMIQLPYKVRPRKLLLGGFTGLVVRSIDIAGVAQVQGAAAGGIPGLVGSPDNNVELALKPIPANTPITVVVQATVAGTVASCGFLADVMD